MTELTYVVIDNHSLVHSNTGGQIAHLARRRDPENDPRPVKELFQESYAYNLEQSSGLLTPAGKKQVDEYELTKGAALVFLHMVQWQFRLAVTGSVKL